jgi:hypothetical protein
MKQPGAEAPGFVCWLRRRPSCYSAPDDPVAQARPVAPLGGLAGFGPYWVELGSGSSFLHNRNLNIFKLVLINPDIESNRKLDELFRLSSISESTKRQSGRQVFVIGWVRKNFSKWPYYGRLNA